jgi:polyferredoxin
VTLLTFLDLTLVRLHFCTTVCPYGYLQGMLGDGHTLLVHYRDEGHACIECKKCVRVCPMGIDIRESPFQIECVHCGECIDACREILARVNQPGLIHYTWGEKGELAGAATGRSWFHRIGIRDAKRVVVLLVLAFYACGLSVALSMRREVLVRVSPDRSELYRAAGDQIANRFRYSIANRGGQRVEVRFTVEQLPGGVVGGGSVPIAAPAGESVSGEFEILAPRAGLREQVSHFTIAATSIPQQEIERIPMTFLAPGEGK